MGVTPASAKPLIGLGAQVLEIVVDHNTDTFRAVYTVRYADRVLGPARFSEEVEERARSA